MGLAGRPQGGAYRQDGRGGPGWEVEGPDQGSEELAPVDSEAGAVGARPKTRGGGHSEVSSHSLVMASISPEFPRPPRKRSLWGDLLLSASPSPRGAAAAGTASRHQLPLRPRAPPPGRNGQRACARTRFPPARWGLGAFTRPAAPPPPHPTPALR